MQQLGFFEELKRFLTFEAFKEMPRTKYVALRKRDIGNKPIGFINMGLSGVLIGSLKLKPGQGVQMSNQLFINTPITGENNLSNEILREVASRAPSKYVIMSLSSMTSLNVITPNSPKKSDEMDQLISENAPGEILPGSIDAKQRARLLRNPYSNSALLVSISRKTIEDLERRFTENGLSIIRICSSAHSLINYTSSIEGVAQGKNTVLISEQGNLYWHGTTWSASQSFKNIQSDDLRNSLNMCPQYAQSEKTPSEPSNRLSEFLIQINKSNQGRQMLYFDTGTSHLPESWLTHIPHARGEWPAPDIHPIAWAASQL